MIPAEDILRRQLALAARRLYRQGLAVAYEGNLSARLGGSARGATRFLVSPARRCKEELGPEEFLRMEEQKPAGRGRPSSEVALHHGIYQQLPEARAVVHAHPPHATAFACTREGLSPLLQPEILQLLGGPVPMAPYAPPGGAELLASVVPWLGRSPVILLANHGLVAISDTSVDDALRLVEQVENVARTTWLARQLGSLRPLSAEEQAQVLARR